MKKPKMREVETGCGAVLVVAAVVIVALMLLLLARAFGLWPDWAAGMGLLIGEALYCAECGERVEFFDVPEEAE